MGVPVWDMPASDPRPVNRPGVPDEPAIGLYGASRWRASTQLLPFHLYLRQADLSPSRHEPEYPEQHSDAALHRPVPYFPDSSPDLPSAGMVLGYAHRIISPSLCRDADRLSGCDRSRPALCETEYVRLCLIRIITGARLGRISDAWSCFFETATTFRQRCSLKLPSRCGPANPLPSSNLR